MGETDRVGLAMPLRLGKKLQRSLLLHGDLAGDVVGRPYSVEDGALLRHLGGFIGQRLRPQEHFPGFGCGIAAACNLRLGEHHVQFERLSPVLGTVGKRLQKLERELEMPNGLRIGRTLVRTLPGFS